MNPFEPPARQDRETNIRLKLRKLQPAAIKVNHLLPLALLVVGISRWGCKDRSRVRSL